jgi:TonB-dependent SusC/RagA subfamily outer membrane receptor
METLLIYLGKVALSIAAFYTFYIVLFRRHKQFRFNRLYLSGSLLLSFIIPLITITITRPAPVQMVILPETGTEINSMVAVGKSGPDYLTLLSAFYFSVVIVFFLRLITGQIKVLSIIRKCRKAVIDGTLVFIFKKDIYPFTFFNRIVISENSLSHPDLRMILKHEKVHAEEKHTLDILMSEVLFLFQWFNPLAWKQKEAVKNNLEFLADQIVIRQSDMLAYQLAMVSMAGKQGIARFLNALNGNDLKNRIIMMKQKTENRNKVTRQLTVIPLLVILILGLSNKEFKAAPDFRQTGKFPELNQTTLDLLAGDSIKKVKKEIIVVGYPAGTSVTDTVKTRIKSSGSNSWTIISAEDQKSTGTVHATSDKNNEKVIQVIGYGVKKDSANFSGEKIIVKATGNNQGSQPLYILDGTEIKSIEGISPDQIESISVLKNESSVALYGEKGKNGVIIITSKKSKTPSDDVLIILDGKETTKKVPDIKAEEIQSVNVLKGESATQKYGEKGAKGVIEITLKHPSDKNISNFTTTREIRQYIASTIQYPVEAQQTGQQGSVRIYAFVSEKGKITQITESKPKAELTSLDEVVIVGYGSNSDRSKENRKMTALNEEAALRVKNLPDLDIPEFKNKWVVFQFKFVLQ